MVEAVSTLSLRTAHLDTQTVINIADILHRDCLFESNIATSGKVSGHVHIVSLESMLLMMPMISAKEAAFISHLKALVPTILL